MWRLCSIYWDMFWTVGLFLLLFCNTLQRYSFKKPVRKFSVNTTKCTLIVSVILYYMHAPVALFAWTLLCRVPEAGMFDGVLDTFILIWYLIGRTLGQ